MMHVCAIQHPVHLNVGRIYDSIITAGVKNGLHLLTKCDGPLLIEATYLHLVVFTNISKP